MSLLLKAIANFLGLTDTPAAYTGEAGKFPKVNVGEDALEFATVAAAVGGLYGINVETLGAGKTLTPNTDEIYQYLDEGGANRIITLDIASATAGDRFVIRHNGDFNDTNYLQVKQGAVVLDHIYAGTVKEFIFDGTNWISGENATGENDDNKRNVAIGALAAGYNYGTAVGGVAWGYTYSVAIGYHTEAQTYGVAVGYDAKGSSYGVGLGYSASGKFYGVAVGYYAVSNEKSYSIALGYYSKCERYGETTINIDAHENQYKNVTQGRWSATTAGGAGATEIFCAGVADQRFTIKPSSALAFRLIVVARDAGGDVARYSVHDGLIKRDGADNTVMSKCTVTVDHEDDNTWDCTVTADDANNALIITVTGDDTNVTLWAAVLDGVEVHF